MGIKWGGGRSRSNEHRFSQGALTNDWFKYHILLPSPKLSNKSQMIHLH